MKTQVLLIIVSAAVIMISLALYISKRLKKVLPSLGEQPDDVTLSDVPADIDKAFDFVKSNIDQCRTKEHLNGAYNLLSAFRHKFGKCDQYHDLHATYVGALYEYNERTNFLF